MSYISRSDIIYMLSIYVFYIHVDSPPSNPICKIQVSKPTTNSHLHPPQQQIRNPSYRKCHLKPNIPCPHRCNRPRVQYLIHRRHYQRYAQQCGRDRRYTRWQEPPPFSFGHTSVFLGRGFRDGVGCEGTRKIRCFSRWWSGKRELTRTEVAAEDEVLDQYYCDEGACPVRYQAEEVGKSVIESV
jgi:hypothetical protein